MGMGNATKFRIVLSDFKRKGRCFTSTGDVMPCCWRPSPEPSFQPIACNMRLPLLLLSILALLTGLWSLQKENNYKYPYTSLYSIFQHGTMDFQHRIDCTLDNIKGFLQRCSQLRAWNMLFEAYFGFTMMHYACIIQAHFGKCSSWNPASRWSAGEWEGKWVRILNNIFFKIPKEGLKSFTYTRVYVQGLVFIYKLWKYQEWEVWPLLSCWSFSSEHWAGRNWDHTLRSELKG